MDNRSQQASRISNFLKIIDIFPQQLSFTHQKFRSYRSVSSGFYSILTLACILSYFLYLVSDVWNFQVSIKNSIMKRDLIFDNTTFDLSEQNFDFAVNLQYLGFNESRSKFLHRFISLNVNPAKVQWLQTDEGTKFVPSYEHVEIEKCSEKDLNGDTKYMEKLGVIGNYYCPQKKNFTFQGSLQSDTYSILGISIRECKQTQLDKFHPGEVCADLEEQKAVASQLLVSFIFTNQYFQGENQLEPIQQDYKLLTLGVPYQQSFFTFLKYSVNYAILEDSWVFESHHRQNVSYSSVRVEQQYGREYQPYSATNPFLLVGVMLDENVSINERTASNMVTVLQSIGGFASVCIAVSKLIFFFLQQFSYLQEMVTLLYSEEQREEVEDESHSERMININSERKNGKLDNSLDLEQSQTKNARLAQKIVNEQNRKRLPKIGICSYLSLKCGKGGTASENSSFNQSQELLQMELNLEGFIKKMRILDVYLQLKLSPLQRTILSTITQRVSLKDGQKTKELDRSIISCPEQREFEDCISTLVSKNHLRQASKFDRKLATHLGFEFPFEQLQSQKKKKAKKPLKEENGEISHKKPQTSFVKIKTGAKNIFGKSTNLQIEKNNKKKRVEESSSSELDASSEQHNH